MFDKNYSKVQNTYISKGTVLIPFEDKLNPLSEKDFKNLFEYCEKVDKEFIEV